MVCLSSSLRVTLNSSQLKKQEKGILPAPIFHIRQTESLEKIVKCFIFCLECSSPSEDILDFVFPFLLFLFRPLQKVEKLIEEKFHHS